MYVRMYVCVCMDVCMYVCDPFLLLIKVPIRIKTSWPKSKIFGLHIEKEPIHTVIKTPEPGWPILL